MKGTSICGFPTTAIANTNGSFAKRDHALWGSMFTMCLLHINWDIQVPYWGRIHVKSQALLFVLASTTIANTGSSQLIVDSWWKVMVDNDIEKVQPTTPIATEEVRKDTKKTKRKLRQVGYLHSSNNASRTGKRLTPK